MAACAGKCIARFLDLDPPKCCLSAAPTKSIRFPHQRYHLLCSLSMNACQGDSGIPVETIETRTLMEVPTLAQAMDQLILAISELNSDPPSFSSGIIRVQVPIPQQIEAIDWLHSQQQILPRFFFSGRRTTDGSGHFIDYTNGNGNAHGSVGYNLVNVAGVGAAVYFQHFHPFSLNDWRSIRRFLSKSCPLIRAYGAIRFDAKADISLEWEPFGSFYFMVPQVEFDELEGSSMLAANIAWDNALSWIWRKAMDALQATLDQVTFVIMKLMKEVLKMSIHGNILHIPNNRHCDVAVNKAL